LVLLIGAGLLGALPWILSLPFAQRRLAAAASAILAPSSVEFESIRLSWLEKTRIANVVLRDAHGDPVLAAPRAEFQWNLRQILFAQPARALLAIDQGKLDIERFADGRIDLHETLKPVIMEHPRKRLVIRITHGRLRFRDAALPEPVVASDADIMIDLATGYQPITWNIQLAREQDAQVPSRVEIAGNFSRSEIDALGRHDLTLAVKAARWPWALERAGTEARGAFSGSVHAQRRAGRLLLGGDATLSDVVAIGGVLASDTIHLDSVHARWKADGGDDGWTIDQLEVNSPLGSLEGKGSIPPRPGQGASIVGTVELAGLAKQLPATLRLRNEVRVERGMALLRAEVRSSGKGPEEDWAVSGKVSDLFARQGQ
jgi:translocation and assembly module TamB